MQTGRWIIAVGIFLLGTASGWGISRLDRPAPATPTSGTQSAIPTASQSTQITPADQPAHASASVRAFSGDWSRDLSAIAAITDPLASAEAARALADTVPLSQLPRLLERVDQLLIGDTHSAFLERLFHRAAQSQPLDALRWLDRYTNTEHEWAVRQTIFDSWAGHDAAAAIRWFEALPPGITRTRAESPIASALGRRAPQLGLELYRRLPRNSQTVEFANNFFSAWVEFNPPAAAQAAFPLLTSPRHAEVLGNLLGIWARRAPDDAVAFLEKLPLDSRSSGIWIGLVTTLAGQNPKVAAGLALRGQSPAIRSRLVESVAYNWASLDSAAAIQWAATLNDSSLRKLALDAAFNQAAEMDARAALELASRLQLKLSDDVYGTLAGDFANRPNDAIQWIDSLPTATARSSAFGGFIQKLAEQNPTAAAALATNLPPGNRRTTAISSVASVLASGDPSTAIAWVQSLGSPQEKANATQSMIWEFSQSDPTRGLALIESLPVGPARNQLYGSLASGWVEQDLDGAVQWLKAIEAGPARDAALGSIALPWASADPVAAAEFAATLAPGDEANSFLSNVASSWAEQDPKAALAWAQRLESPEAARSAMDSVVTQWAEDSPKEAMEFARTLTDPESQKGAVLAVMNSWSTSNPEEAAKWLAQLPNPELRAEAANFLVNNWASNDPVAAARWLADQPAEARSDEAISALAGSLAQFEPASALQWAGAIQDAEARRQETVRLTLGWIYNYPTQAAEWLAKSGLDAETLQAIEAGRSEAYTPPNRPTFQIPRPYPRNIRPF